MNGSSARSIVVVLLLAAGVATACRSGSSTPAAVDARPAAAAADSSAAAAPPVSPAATVAGTSGAPRRHSAADTRFIQLMVAHHAQALAMTGLVPTRASRRDVKLLAERIAVSQRDELALMRRWLQERGEPVPELDTPHRQHDAGGHAGAMPGMLTSEELARLTAANGAEFDRLFLEYMIRHHEGALAMVAELLRSQGAAQEAATFRLVNDVDADQRAEIARMRAMLGAPPSEARHH